MIGLKHAIDGAELLPRRLTSEEVLGQPFRLDLEVISDATDLRPSDALGTAMDVWFDLPEGAGQRRFHAVVAGLTFQGYAGRRARYRVALRPNLWLLSRTSDCRIFQNETIPDIVKKVLRDHSIACRDAMQHASRCPPLEYCVQYRESTLHFVNRLLEQAGIYYFFEHEEGSHTLVLADDPASHSPLVGNEAIPFHADGSARLEGAFIRGWRVDSEVQAGKYAIDDFDFARPGANLAAQAAKKRSHRYDDLEVFDYPGEYDDPEVGTRYADMRLQELQARFEVVSGEARRAGLAPGATFELQDHPRDDQNKRYLLTGVWHHALIIDSGAGSAGSFEHSCRFDALDAPTPYRSPRVTPKPVVHGLQTAIVVGRDGDEIHTDAYGRIKVHFHWDRHGKRDDQSSCFVRVAHAWAGSGWGAIHIPRVGQEVIVQFLEGDPDRPVVTGRLYNGDNKPPYDLPANQTQSGIKSRSTKAGGADNFNEIRLEDKKGAELIHVQAERDYEALVKNDRRQNIGNDEELEVGKNQTETVGEDKKLDIGGNHDEKIGESARVEVGKDQEVSVGQDMRLSVKRDRSVDVGGSLSENVTKNLTLTVEQDESREVGKSYTVRVGKDHSENTSGDYSLEALKIVQSAKDSIEIRVGQASITLKKNGDIQIKGGKIKIQGSSDVVVKGSKIAAN